MTKIAFNYTTGTKSEAVFAETVTTDFVNLKNKAEGARRYGYRAEVQRWTNPEGQVAFVSYYQTTLNGAAYQSSKRGDFLATEADALAALKKTIAGALKRYAKLATDPASKIERR